MLAALKVVSALLRSIGCWCFARLKSIQRWLRLQRLRRERRWRWMWLAGQQYASVLSLNDQRLREKGRYVSPVSPSNILLNFLAAVGVLSLIQEAAVIQLKSLAFKIVIYYKSACDTIVHLLNMYAPEWLVIGKLEWQSFLLVLLLFCAFARARYRHVVARGEPRNIALGRVMINMRLNMTFPFLMLLLPEPYSYLNILGISGAVLLQDLFIGHRFPWAPRTADIMVELSMIAVWVASIILASMFITI